MLNLSLEVHGPTKSSSETVPPVHESVVKELLHSVEVASSFASKPASFNAASEEEAKALEARPSRDGSTMVAIKLSGLLHDASVLERASAR